MPMKPKRPCSYPGCPRLVDGQYCEEHKKLVDKQYNQYGRDNFTKSFYKTTEWQIARKRQLQAQPFCEECLKNGKRTKATIVDHIIPIKQGGDKFAPNNLESLCWSCHSRKSVEEGSRFGVSVKYWWMDRDRSISTKDNIKLSLDIHSQRCLRVKHMRE